MKNYSTEQFDYTGLLFRHIVTMLIASQLTNAFYLDYSLIPEVFNVRPQQYKYMFVCDVPVVLNVIKTQWESTNSLSDRDISLKLCILLALTTVSRGSSLDH